MVMGVMAPLVLGLGDERMMMMSSLGECIMDHVVMGSYDDGHGIIW